MANNWIPLDGKKDPPFYKILLVFDQGGHLNQAGLKEINQNWDGKSYVFFC